MRNKRTRTGLLVMNANIMNKRARQSTHSLERRPPILPSQKKQEIDHANCDGCDTLQNIARPSLCSPGTINPTQIAFAQTAESSVV